MVTAQPTHEQVLRQQWRRALWFVALLVGAEVLVWLWSHDRRSTFGLAPDDALRITLFLFAGVQILIVALRALREGFLHTRKKLVFRQEQPAAFFCIVAGLLAFGFLILVGAIVPMLRLRGR